MERKTMKYRSSYGGMATGKMIEEAYMFTLAEYARIRRRVDFRANQQRYKRWEESTIYADMYFRYPFPRPTFYHRIIIYSDWEDVPGEMDL